jgi:hypothetical protein
MTRAAPGQPDVDDAPRRAGPRSPLPGSLEEGEISGTGGAPEPESAGSPQEGPRHQEDYDQ